MEVKLCIIPVIKAEFHLATPPDIPFGDKISFYFSEDEQSSSYSILLRSDDGGETYHHAIVLRCSPVGNGLLDICKHIAKRAKNNTTVLISGKDANCIANAIREYRRAYQIEGFSFPMCDLQVNVSPADDTLRIDYDEAEA